MNCHWYDIEKLSLGLVRAGKAGALSAEVLYGDEKSPLIVKLDGKLFFSQNALTGNGYWYPLAENWRTSARFTEPEKYGVTIQMVRHLLWRDTMSIEKVSERCRQALEAWLQE